MTVKGGKVKARITSIESLVHITSKPQQMLDVLESVLVDSQNHARAHNIPIKSYPVKDEAEELDIMSIPNSSVDVSFVEYVVWEAA